jgi:hypothetical protein
VTRVRIAARGLSAGALAAAFERCAPALVVAFGALVTAATCSLADRKPLWADEMFTYHIANLPTFGDVWSALARGFEQHPPGFYATTRAVIWVLGESNIAIRLPAVAGFLLMTICLFSFVSRRAGAVYGCIAMVFPLLTLAWSYAYEARGYGLALGFTSAALVCWQRAAEGHRRRARWVAGLAASLAAAVSSHYYALLIVIPIALGELTRTLSRRRCDWAVVCSLGGAIVPMAIAVPLLRAGRSYAPHFWAKPDWHTATHFYTDFLLSHEVLIAASLLLAAAGLATLLSRLVKIRRGATVLPLPAHELVAAAGLVLLPAWGLVAGKLAVGAFTDRYALPAVTGLSILVAVAARQLDRGKLILAAPLLVVMCLHATERFGELRSQVAWLDHRDRNARALLRSAHNTRLPLVVASGLDFLELSHDVSQTPHLRLAYLADTEAALRYFGVDTVERGILELGRIARLQVVPYRDFLRSHQRFLVFGRSDVRNWGYFAWLPEQLRHDRRQIRVWARSDDGTATLYEVTGRRG